MIKNLLKSLALIILPTVIFSYSNAAEFTVETLNNLNQPHNVQLSPQGDFLVFGLKKGAASTDNHLYRQNIKSGKIQQLTSHEKSETNVVFSNDGSSLYFLTARSGLSQIWQLPLLGGEAKQITDLPLDINGFKISANGKVLALSLTVKPGCPTLKCSVEAKKADKNKKYQIRAYDQLMVRHWDTWTTEYKNHLFVAQLSPQSMVTDVTDLITNWNTDIAGMAQVSLHPEGTSIVFSAKVPAKNNAWNTNFDIFEVDLTPDSKYELINLTQSNKAWDASPVYSSNGRFLAYLAMARVSYESDKYTIMLRDNNSGKTSTVAKKWDRSVKSLIFSNDNRSLLVTAQDVGQVSIFEINPEFGDVRTVYNSGTAADVSVHNNTLYFTRHNLNSPKDIFSIQRDGYGLKQLTDFNKETLENVSFGEFEQFSFKGWNNEQVHGYWLKPANFESSKKYPIAYLVHGGPQGSFGNMFHYRWNAQLWAAQGFGVVMVDFHGSTGYGQAFTDSIARDWGGKPFEDLQKGLSYIVENQPWLDGANACALGASYGGYMMNWFAGNWPDRFKCIINHAGLFDIPSFYQSTEELWFPEHDLGGVPWKTKDHNGKLTPVSEDYTKFNPSAYVEYWKTPMLVIQGELDYRVPYTQSLGAFTTLQRQGIDSRLVMFPNEDHHIRKPDNLAVWYKEVFNWMNTYLKAN